MDSPPHNEVHLGADLAGPWRASHPVYEIRLYPTYGLYTQYAGHGCEGRWNSAYGAYNSGFYNVFCDYVPHTKAVCEMGNKLERVQDWPQALAVCEPIKRNPPHGKCGGFLFMKLVGKMVRSPDKTIGFV